MDKERIIELIRFVVGLLVLKDYESLVQFDSERRLSVDAIKNAIEGYGGKVISPPDSAYNNINYYWQRDKNQVSIDFDLWIDNAQSDLTLQANIKKSGSEYFYAIDDIHVL